jgi:uncharacterized protein (DUF1501 family)
MVSRREFLRASSIVSLSPLVPGMLCRAARAAGAAADAPVLVVIQLDGGNDGLNTVVPYADDAYARLRPKLHVPAERILKLDDHVGLHPQMRAAKELFDDGRLAVVQGVGYPNPDRSHFRSMRIWQTASFDDLNHNGYGWLGRAMDARIEARAMTGAISSDPAGDASLVYVGEGETPVALWARRAAATSMSRIDDLVMTSAPGRISATTAADADVRQFVTRQVLSAHASAKELSRRRSVNTLKNAKYPDSSLAENLQVVSQLIQSGAQARVYYAAQNGYDTHAAQQFTHANLLGQFSLALKAFLDDLHDAGLAERVVVLAFSEFGRRAAENDSQGTDHGAAGPVFVAGAPVRGGLVGAAPDLANLEAGDVRMELDFRHIYATLLDDWLSVDSGEVLGDNFGSVRIFGNAHS